MNKYAIASAILFAALITLTAVAAAGIFTNAEEAQTANENTIPYGGACTDGHIRCRINSEDVCEHSSCSDGEWNDYVTVGQAGQYECKRYEVDGDDRGERCVLKAEFCVGLPCFADITSQTTPLPEDFDF